MFRSLLHSHKVESRDFLNVCGAKFPHTSSIRTTISELQRGLAISVCSLSSGLSLHQRFRDLRHEVNHPCLTMCLPAEWWSLSIRILTGAGIYNPLSITIWLDTRMPAVWDKFHKWSIVRRRHVAHEWTEQVWWITNKYDTNFLLQAFTISESSCKNYS